MGYSISWVAVRERAPEAVLEDLALHRSGRFGACADHPVVAQATPDGWFVVVADHCDDPLIEPENLARLSRDSELVACSIEEQVMFSSSECWKDGARKWHVEHDARYGLDHLRTAGELPADRSAVAQAWLRQQEQPVSKKAGKELNFEVPLQIAREIVGFKHDQATPAVEGGRFEILLSRPSASNHREPAKRPWWRIWQARFARTSGKTSGR